MLSHRPLPSKLSLPRWLWPLCASVLLPSLFIVIMGTASALAPSSTALATVFAALLAALVLRQLVPSLGWAGVALVTFWFVISGAVGGVVILLVTEAGLPSLTGGLGGILAMFALQAMRVWWQFQRAQRSGTTI